MAAQRAIPIQGHIPVYTCLWSDNKPAGSEGAVLRVLNSAFFPVLGSEIWVYHDGMWTFDPSTSGFAPIY